MNNKNTLWYTRQKGSIKGPFNAAIIGNNLLLGRLKPNDEVSIDQVNWYQLVSQPQFTQHLGSEAMEQLKKSLDERNGFDRRFLETTDLPSTVQHRQNDRRQHETDLEIRRRQLHTLLMNKFRQRKEKLFWPLITTLFAVSITFMLAILYPEKLPIPLAKCNETASPNVNWSNCLKPQIDLQNQDLTHAQLRNSQLIGSNMMNTTLIGADIAYADLRFTNLSYSQLQNAILIGANLNKADLSYADLTEADLSYANLTGANLGGSLLNTVRLDHAIWINGQTCAPNSIGRCIKLEQ
ncbi:MAG: pentapeptide repeat-containing protein [Gammaproteobacteria bacterium]|nr:pentapeptide repeat-containing protein [Gammaproteobacteria bacterium]MDH5592386.1 pentapeptide repeat-containing protein [Gammaproteobacteria bacterium]